MILRDRHRSNDIGDQLLYVATAQLGMRRNDEAVAEHMRRNVFDVVRQDIITPLKGSPGLADLVKRQGGARAGTERDIHVGTGGIR